MTTKIVQTSVTLSPSKELRDGMDTDITNALNALYHDGKPKRRVTYAVMRSLFVRAVNAGMEEGAEQAVKAGFEAGFKAADDDHKERAERAGAVLRGVLDDVSESMQQEIKKAKKSKKDSANKQ